MSKGKNDEDAIIRGSDNVFADLKFKDPDTHLLKSQLVNRIRAVILEKGLTQNQAAEIIGLSQPDVSRILRGQFRDTSVERLMRMLTRLGCTVDLVVKTPQSTRAQSIHFVGKETKPSRQPAGSVVNKSGPAKASRPSSKSKRAAG